MHIHNSAETNVSEEMEVFAHYTKLNQNEKLFGKALSFYPSAPGFVKSGVHPYLAAILKKGDGDFLSNVLGSGTLIHPGIVLTERKITWEYDKSTNKSVYVVDQADDVFVLIDHKISSSTEKRPVKHIREIGTLL